MSATQAKQNQLQGRWLLRQGWVPHQTLTQMLHALQGGAQGDLCSQLLARGLIDPKQAEQARQAARHAITGAFSREKLPNAQAQVAWDQQAPSRSPLPPPSALIQAPQSFSTRNDSHSGDGSLVNSQANSEEIQRSQLKAGDLFRDYEILGEISRGAMGVIFRARHCISDKIVALKFILQEHPDATEVERFRQEAETLIQLDSEHIVQILDFGSDQGRLFYAMELIDGRDFYNVVTDCFRLESQAPPFRESMRYLRDIAAALAY
ncbi:MAG: protein kinase, partial [Planctomycetota bacterium]|nr:protein kinase [Planctomycetota bacterium]